MAVEVPAKRGTISDAAYKGGSVATSTEGQQAGSLQVNDYLVLPGWDLRGGGAAVLGFGNLSGRIHQPLVSHIGVFRQRRLDVTQRFLILALGEAGA